jgi:hypothetical protein
MAFNVKSEWAATLANHILSQPNRDGISGFWRASLSRVQDERIYRLAQIPRQGFVLEADIDSERTHVMVADRFDEYVEHALLKRSRTAQIVDVDFLRRAIRKYIDRGRVVAALRNARPISGDTGETGRNPVWYTSD